MKSFVKVNNGCFPNVNFYLAWEAFIQMGYSVTLFEEKDIDTLDITVDTPVFAGVTVFRKVIEKLGINYPPFDCYPKVLNPYYRRKIEVSTLGEVRKKFLADDIRTESKSVFVKPIKPKEFTGVVLNSILNLIPLAHKSDDIPVYVCEPMEILSEFRVYVHDGDILGIKHYYGEWNFVPDKRFVEDVIRNYKSCPIAYGIDIGVNDTGGKKTINGDWSYYDSSFVLEVNDGCNLGNYGLDSIYYGEMIVARWFEIMANHKVENEIEKISDNFKGTKYEKEYTKDSFDKPMSEWGSVFSRKELMLKSQLKIAREESMKSFADGVMKQLKEEKST